MGLWEGMRQTCGVNFQQALLLCCLEQVRLLFDAVSVCMLHVPIEAVHVHLRIQRCSALQRIYCSCEQNLVTQKVSITFTRYLTVVPGGFMPEDMCTSFADEK